MYSSIIQTLFGFALFFNAVLFLPQAIRIYRSKSSQALSLSTFVGFIAIQFSCVLYGLLIEDWILVIGYALSILTCGSVVSGIILYR
ncbi:PQ-loop domain-containing transporter [Cysteiniphilum marinum]|uniref:PQ-loop domain-containing transporter n=1 Tax=Cysteiniphilum marinum TaxID=2774191 RepID=UPI00177D8732